MKHLMLISILCLLAACGPKGNKSKSNSSMGQPYLSVLSPEGSEGEVIIPIIVENEEIVETEETVETEEPVVIVETEETNEETTEPVEVINEEAKALVCDFSSANEQSTLSLLIKNKMVVLKGSKSQDKITFDGHIFSPSGNENAAVHHEDKNFSVAEGKVLKITARILISEDLKTGELQVSYKVKTEDKKTIETEYVKLADVNNCVQE